MHARIFRRVVQTNYEQKNYWNRNSNTFNEYIVYDERQVAVRYVLKLATGHQVTKSSEELDDEADNESNSSDHSDEDMEDMEDSDEQSDVDEEME